MYMITKERGKTQLAATVPIRVNLMNNADAVGLNSRRVVAIGKFERPFVTSRAAFPLRTDRRGTLIGSSPSCVDSVFFLKIRAMHPSFVVVAGATGNLGGRIVRALLKRRLASPRSFGAALSWAESSD
jgi:hypothetical protein